MPPLIARLSGANAQSGLIFICRRGERKHFVWRSILTWFYSMRKVVAEQFPIDTMNAFHGKFIAIGMPMGSIAINRS